VVTIVLELVVLRIVVRAEIGIVEAVVITVVTVDAVGSGVRAEVDVAAAIVSSVVVVAVDLVPIL